MGSNIEGAKRVQNGPERVHSDKDPMLTYPYYVQRLRHETHDTFTIELRPARAVEMTPFSPGQFNMLYVFGLGEIPISISGDPGNQERLIHTTRAVGAVTKAMMKLKRGNMIGVRGPFGTKWPVKEAMGRDILIVAGGIGLPPLRPAPRRRLEPYLGFLHGIRKGQPSLWHEDTGGYPIHKRAGEMASQARSRGFHHGRSR